MGPRQHTLWAINVSSTAVRATLSTWYSHWLALQPARSHRPPQGQQCMRDSRLELPLIHCPPICHWWSKLVAHRDTLWYECMSACVCLYVCVCVCMCVCVYVCIVCVFMCVICVLCMCMCWVGVFMYVYLCMCICVLCVCVGGCACVLVCVPAKLLYFDIAVACHFPQRA